MPNLSNRRRLQATLPRLFFASWVYELPQRTPSVSWRRGGQGCAFNPLWTPNGRQEAKKTFSPGGLDRAVRLRDSALSTGGWRLTADRPTDSTGARQFPALLARAAVLLPVLAVYLTSFWGGFGPEWPSFVREYCGSLVRRVMDSYARHTSIPPSDYLSHYRVIWLLVGVVMAAIIPLSLAALTGRPPGCMGLRLPNRWGWKMVALCIGITIPFAYFFAGERLEMVGRHQPSARLQLLVMVGVSIPEHIFLTGVCLACFGPGWRLPRPKKLAAVEGVGLKRALRWLGLAQPAGPGLPLGHRILVWWGLDGPSLLAVTCAGMLFGLIHVGAGPVELTASFPGGFALCYLAWRSGSIWPGWLIHMFQILVVAGFILVRGGG